MSNSICISHSLFLSPQNCSTSNSCLLKDECIDGVCFPPLRTCPSDCSGHGRCQYVNINTGAVMDECRERDIRCTVQCDCDSSYIGSAICNMNVTESQGRMVLRTKLLQNIMSLVSMEYPAVEALQDWTNLLSESTSAPDELNSTTANYVFDISQSILMAGKSLTSESSSVLNLLPSIDSAANVMMKGTGTQENETAVLLSLLQLCGSTISATMLPTQYAIQSIHSQFRMSVVVLSSSEDGLAKPLTLPQNALEIVSYTQPQQVDNKQPKSEWFDQR